MPRRSCTGGTTPRTLADVRQDPRTIDVGVRAAVLCLNRIPGVRTRASCEGAGAAAVRHRHSDLAYVLFSNPMPLRLQEFLVEQLQTVARVEGNGIYSRWRAQNRIFLERLEVAARAYLSQRPSDRFRCVRRPLPKLRARLARHVARGQECWMGLCLSCEDLVSEPHLESHRMLRLFMLPADLPARWFAQFASEPQNALQADLIASDGWPQLVARTQRNEFGTAYRRRWLRYRARMVADLTTLHLRTAVEQARRQGADLDFFYDNTHAVFGWDIGIQQM